MDKNFDNKLNNICMLSYPTNHHCCKQIITLYVRALWQYRAHADLSHISQLVHASVCTEQYLSD